jgi:hypothetical protein
MTDSDFGSTESPVISVASEQVNSNHCEASSSFWEDAIAGTEFVQAVGDDRYHDSMFDEATVTLSNPVINLDEGAVDLIYQDVVVDPAMTLRDETDLDNPKLSPAFLQELQDIINEPAIQVEASDDTGKSAASAVQNGTLMKPLFRRTNGVARVHMLSLFILSHRRL